MRGVRAQAVELSQLPCPRAKRGEATSVAGGGRSGISEEAYAHGMDVHRDRWWDRAHDPNLTNAQREYAARRLAAIARTYESKLAKCRDRGMDVDCGCANPRVRQFGCRQHLACVYCRVQRAKSLTSRVRDALACRYREARADNDSALLVMATISLRHTGEVRADRMDLAAAWKRFRKACHKRWGGFSFVGTFEVTPGRDGLGHVHAHMVCIWPRGVPGDATQGDWELLRKLWLAAARGASTRISFVASKKPRDAAAYVAKYIAKGVTTSGFDPVLAGKIVAATYNTRWVVTSRGFWLVWPPPCHHCGQPVCRVSVRHQWGGPPPPEHHDPPDWKQTAFALDDEEWRGGHR